MTFPSSFNRLFFTLIVLFSFGVNAKAQLIKVDTATRFTLVKSIAVASKQIETDPAGNIYLVSKTNQFYKYNRDGKLLSTLNYAYQGNLETVDPGNPMELYLFYKEMNKLVFLDNNLAFRGEINFADFEVGQAAAAARAYDNSIWVFDQIDLMLKKYDKDGKSYQNSGNVRQYVKDETILPNFITDNGNRVFLNDPINGVLVFDLMCSYIKTIPIKGCKKIKVRDDDIYYFKDSCVYRYNTKTFQHAAIRIPYETGNKESSIEKERLYILREDSLSIYSY